MATRGASTRAALIRAATELAGEIGYHQATTKIIAERAGVAEGSIYRHFPDKRSLFTAAILEAQHDVTVWMSGLPARAGTAPVIDILTDTFIQLSKLREGIVPLELAAAAEPDLNPQIALPNLTNATVQVAVADLGGPPHLLAQYLAAEQALGYIRADIDPTYSAIVLLAALFGMQISPLARQHGLDAAALGHLAHTLTHGLAPPH